MPQEARRRSNRQLKVSSKAKDSDVLSVKREESSVAPENESVQDGSDKAKSVGVKCERAGSPIVWFSPSPAVNEEKVNYGWNHPAELDYITPADWNDTKIIHHLIAHSFDIPGKNLKPGSPFIQITCSNGLKIVLPAGYRVPLMFIARFQWLSLKLVLSAEKRESEWSDYKFGILHVSRLCKKLLEAAQDSMGALDLEPGAKLKGMDRKWRCQTFDRALARYKMRWFISDPSQVREFWEQYKDDEYEKDVLKFNWRGWALKGHRGFALTDEEITNGITAQQLMHGLKEKDRKWYWDIEDTPVVGGTDAWSLRHAALASWAPLKTKCTVPPTPKTSKPLSAALKPTQPQAQPRTKAPASTTEKDSPKIKAKNQANVADMMKIIGSPTSNSQSCTDPSSPPVLGKSTAVNGVTHSSTTAAVAPVATTSAKPVEGSNGSGSSTIVSSKPTTTASIPSKRPGSPLEKGGSTKRPSISATVVETTSTGSASSAALQAAPLKSSQMPPPSSNTGVSTPVKVKREPSPDPDIEVLRSRPPRVKRRSMQHSRRGSPSPSPSTKDSDSKGKEKETGSHASTSGSSGSQPPAAFSNITKDEAARLMGASESEWRPLASSLKSQNRDESDTMDVDKDQTLTSATAPKVGSSISRPSSASNDEIPGLTRQETQTHKSPVTPLLTKPAPIPIPIPIPHYPASVSKPRSTPFNPTFIHIPKIPPSQSQTSRPTPSPSPASSVSQDKNSSAAAQAFMNGSMNALGLNLRMPPPPPQQQQARPSSAIPNSAIPPRPNGSATGSAPRAAAAAMSNPENMVLIIDSLFAGFSESLKRFSEQIREFREDGLREMKTAMQGVVQAEFRKSGVPQGVDSATIQREVARGLENSLGGSIESRLEKVFRDSIDQGMGSRMEKAMKTGFEEMGKAMGQLMVGITRDAVGGVVRGLNQNVDQMRNELARSREREQDLIRMLNTMQADIKSVKQTLDQMSGYRANVAGPSIAAPIPIPPPVSGLDVFSSHPLAHLLGEMDTNPSSSSHSGIDLDQLYRHHSPQQEQAPPALPDRSNSGTPMSMDSDILLVEAVEQKYKIPEQGAPAPRPITPVLPPTPASPSLANQDDIVDVKPIIIDGEAFLPNSNGEPIPVSSFRPSYPMPAKSNRKFRKMVADGPNDSISAA